MNIKLIKKFNFFVIFTSMLLLFGGRHVNCQESATYFFNFEPSSFIHPTVPTLSTPTNSTLDALAFDFGVVNQSLDLAGS